MKIMSIVDLPLRNAYCVSGTIFSEICRNSLASKILQETSQQPQEGTHYGYHHTQIYRIYFCMWVLLRNLSNHLAQGYSPI